MKRHDTGRIYKKGERKINSTGLDSRTPIILIETPHHELPTHRGTKGYLPVYEDAGLERANPGRKGRHMDADDDGQRALPLR